MSDKSQLGDRDLVSLVSDRSEVNAINDEAEQKIIDAETELGMKSAQPHRFTWNFDLELLIFHLQFQYIASFLADTNSSKFEKTAHMIVYVGARIACITTVVTARLFTAIRMFDRMGIQAIGGKFQSLRELRRELSVTGNLIDV